MSYSAAVIEVFLSSPGDVRAERELVVSLAAEWNRLRSRDTGCFISILTWEEVVAPALGLRPQEIVNDQIGRDYDVYLSIMWAVLGTPTGVAESGTVEEFDQAIDRARSGDNVRIAALFKKAPVDLESIDPAQLQKVRDFKARVGKEGAFYREFSDESSLRSIINLLFEQIAKDKSSYLTNFMEDGYPPKPFNPPETIEIEEIGLVEVGEIFEQKASDLIELMGELAEAEKKNNETLMACVADMNVFSVSGSRDAEIAKSFIERAATSLGEVADFYDLRIDDIEKLLLELARLSDQDIRIRLEFEDPAEAASGNIDAMRGLSQTIGDSLQQLDGLIASTSALPRMSVDLTRAKNKLTNSRQRLRQSFSSLKESIDSSISFFEDKSRS